MLHERVEVFGIVSVFEGIAFIFPVFIHGNNYAVLLSLPFNVLYTILGESSGATLALTLKGTDVPASLIRRACRWAKSGHAGLPGGVEDVLESVTPSAALWLVSAILSMAQTEQVDKPSATVQTERLIA